MNIERATRTVVTETLTLLLTGADILALLKETGRIPKNADGSVQVDAYVGGKDTSTLININSEDPIKVVVQTSKES